MGVTMKRLGVLLIGLILLSTGAMAAVVPLVRGPQDPGALNQTLNQVIQSINGILSPLTGGTAPVVAGSNSIALNPGVPGQPAQIALQSGGDANAGIQINPNGSGNIILFGQGDTGLLQFANATSFIPATSLIACPGVPAGKGAPIGVSTTVTGFTPIKDWLGRTHAWPTC